jgi:tRNA(Ile)-lysidine synthase
MKQEKRSHPRSLWRTVKKTLQEECNIPNGSHLLIGVSGGSDSIALLNVLAILSKEMYFRVSAIGINHNLREEAASELDVAESLAKSLGVPFYKRNVYLGDGGNVQSRARDLRYAAIRELQNEIGADFIVTAHHANDRAETVLMRIMKKTTAPALNVLNAQFEDVLRPMIRAYKCDVMLYIERNKLTYCEDPSNKNTKKYLRSKIRYDIMPMLAEVNPNIIEALCSLSDSARK